VRNQTLLQVVNSIVVISLYTLISFSKVAGEKKCIQMYFYMPVCFACKISSCIHLVCYVKCVIHMRITILPPQALLSIGVVDALLSVWAALTTAIIKL